MEYIWISCKLKAALTIHVAYITMKSEAIRVSAKTLPQDISETKLSPASHILHQFLVKYDRGYSVYLVFFLIFFKTLPRGFSCSGRDVPVLKIAHDKAFQSLFGVLRGTWGKGERMPENIEFFESDEQGRIQK